MVVDETQTPDASPYLEKMWAHAKSKGFESPSAQERRRERRAPSLRPRRSAFPILCTVKRWLRSSC